jgi:hypothetical protein
MSDENEVLYDNYGFNDATGLHRDTGTAVDPNGFYRDGIHRTTETEFSPLTRLTRDGYAYDSRGYNYAGYNDEGYDREGYDSDGYDRDGLDSATNSRCDNGECDRNCSCRDSFDDQLDGYGTRAPRVLGWAPHPDLEPTYLYAGHEIEMYSDDEDFSDVEHTLHQVNTLYAGLNPLTRNRRCAIAKHDGSLEDGGFELVTVPLTTEQVYGIFGKIKTLGDGRCSAWDRGDDVGHHIHLSKRAIGPLTLGKLLVFMNAERNRSFLEAIACRPAGFNHFCTKKVTDQGNSDRYEVLNVTDSTVEFRLFKSNLYGRAILKNHEFAVAAVRFCEQVSHGFGEVDSHIDPLHFVNFRTFVAANRHTYRYLHEFLLSHTSLRVGYRNNAGLPDSVANPKEKSPVFRMIRRTDIEGA